jgi:dihydrofolate reductase
MLPYVTKMYLTHIHSVIQGDTYLNIDYSIWSINAQQTFSNYSFVDYSLKKQVQ